jgi:uncharacterized membrane protein YdjX (TVP38/TMEM64 family)
MLTRFMYLKENSKFLIVASIICALIILAVVVSLPGSPLSNDNGGYWAQIISGIH